MFEEAGEKTSCCYQEDDRHLESGLSGTGEVRVRNRLTCLLVSSCSEERVKRRHAEI